MDKKVICFDLEGPLSPQDNAYEVMGLFDNGHKIFEVVSKYDDILALEQREGYEPGDTLSLIIPFLMHHGISEDDISAVSRKARIVRGAAGVISRLKQLGWSPYIISTSYQQHAYNIGRSVGVPEDRIYCTHLPLNEFREQLGDAEASMIRRLERDILAELYPHLDGEERIKEVLDGFYYEDIIGTRLEAVMKRVRVVGGMRKVEAMEKIAREAGVGLSDLIVVGDSITDYKMLDRVRANGGIAVVFNGNMYAIPYANIALATTNMFFLLVIVAGYMRGGPSGVIDSVRHWEINHDKFMKDPASIPDNLITEEVRRLLIQESKNPDFFHPHFHFLQDNSEEEIEAVARIHAKSRAIVRGDAAKLG